MYAGYRIGLMNAVTGTNTVYCVTDHMTMLDAFTELKMFLKLKPEDRLTISFHPIGYGNKHNTDIHVPATIEYDYDVEQDDSLP